MASALIAITTARNEAVLRLHAADSRMELAIKTHLIPRIADGLAGLGLLTSALLVFFDSDRVCVDWVCPGVRQVLRIDLLSISDAH